jgi:ferredoxin--NADP+ reductase
MTGTTTSLCVRRATYWDEEMGKDDPAKAGIYSIYPCFYNNKVYTLVVVP